MLFLRSLLYFIGSSILLIIFTIIAIFISFTSNKFRYQIISKWAKFCIWWLNVTCNLKIKFEGLENIPKEQCVIIVNHQSTLDTLFLQSVMPVHTWVIKKQLLFIPFFGWCLAILSPIVINREAKIKALKKIIAGGVKKLKNKISVVIYPEGTRQKYGKLGKYQSGGILMAQKANVAILPVSHNAGKFWPKGSFIKNPGVVTVRIGNIIDKETIKNANPKDLSNQILQWTEEQIKSFK